MGLAVQHVVVSIDVVYKMKTWKQAFLVMVHILHYSIQIQR